MLWYSCILGYFFNLKGFTNFFWRFFAFSWLAILGVIFFKCSAHISIYLEIIIISKWSFIELDKVQNPKKVKKKSKSKTSPYFNAKKRSQLGLLTFFGVWTFDFFLTLHLFFEIGLFFYFVEFRPIFEWIYLHQFTVIREGGPTKTDFIKTSNRIHDRSWHAYIAN